MKNKQKIFLLCVSMAQCTFTVYQLSLRKRKKKVFKLKSFSYLRYVSEIGVFFIYVYNLMDMLGLSTYFFWRKWQIEIFFLFFSWFMPQNFLISFIWVFFWVLSITNLILVEWNEHYCRCKLYKVINGYEFPYWVCKNLH